MSRSPFGWSYPPGCSGPPEDHPRRCVCGEYDENHDIDEDGELICPETRSGKFEEMERPDGPLEDYDQIAKDGEL